MIRYCQRNDTDVRQRPWMNLNRKKCSHVDKKKGCFYAESLEKLCNKTPAAPTIDAEFANKVG